MCIPAVYRTESDPDKACGDVRLLRTIRSVDFTGQERAALNKVTMPADGRRSIRRPGIRQK